MDTITTDNRVALIDTAFSRGPHVMPDFDVYQILEQYSDGVLIVEDNQVTFANVAAHQLLGFSGLSLLGKPCPYFDYLRLSMPVNLDLRGINDKHVEMRCSEVLWREHHALLVVLRDVTEQVRWESLLVREREWLRALLHTLPDAIVVLDEAFRIDYCNQAAAQLAGRALFDLQHRSIKELLLFQDRETKSRIAFSVVYEDYCKQTQQGTIQSYVTQRSGARIPISYQMFTVNSQHEPKSTVLLVLQRAQVGDVSMSVLHRYPQRTTA